jgi:hypothetical protein
MEYSLRPNISIACPISVPMGIVFDANEAVVTTWLSDRLPAELYVLIHAIS